MDWEGIAFALYVIRDLLCVSITFQMTVPSPPVLGASGTSSRLLDFTGPGRWHCSRVPKVLPDPEHSRGRTRQLQLAALSEASETYSLLFKAANTIHNGSPSLLYRSEYAHDEERSGEQV